MGVVLTTGFATITVGSYNVLSLIFVVMFFGLGVDFAVHFALRVREAAGEGKLEDACRTAVNDIGPALVLCMITSMVAFLSFSPTAYRGLAELGVISAGGMFVAFGLTITLFPALFSIYGVPPRPGTKFPKFELKLNPAPVLIAVTALSLVAFYHAREVRFDYSVLAMRDASTEAMTTLLELQEEQIVTDYSISVLAADAEQAAILKQELQGLDVVGDVTIPLDFLPTNQPVKQEKLQTLLALYETIDEVLPSAAEGGLEDALAYLAETTVRVAEEDQYLVRNMNTGLNAYVQDKKLLVRFDQALFQAMESELAQLRRMLTAEPFGLVDIADDLKRRMITAKGEHLLTVQPAEPLTTRESTEEFITRVNEVVPNIAGRSVVEWGVGDVVVKSFLFAGSLSAVVIFALSGIGVGTHHALAAVYLRNLQDYRYYTEHG